MTDNEIELMNEIRHKIRELVDEFYRSKRSLESFSNPHGEIRTLLTHYYNQYYIVAKLHSLEKTVSAYSELQI